MIWRTQLLRKENPFIVYRTAHHWKIRIIHDGISSVCLRRPLIPPSSEDRKLSDAIKLLLVVEFDEGGIPKSLVLFETRDQVYAVVFFGTTFLDSLVVVGYL